MVKQKSQKSSAGFSPRIIGAIADEVAKRLPSVLTRKKTKRQRTRKIEHAFFLDTSAIIDGRIFEVISLGLISGIIVVTESVLLELKHIADSQDAVKRERGRNGLGFLEKLKKNKGVKVLVLSINEEKKYTDSHINEVDEKLIRLTKIYKGRVITCDYNLEKKASIQGITAINVNALANVLKVRAVPGDALHVQIMHQGKDVTQGVGYLDDGTMIVIENASSNIGKQMDVVVSRVIQTATGRILFAKKI